MAGWMLRMLAASVLIALAAWLLEQGLRAVGRPRRWAWVTGLGAVLAAPFAALVLPGLPLLSQPLGQWLVIGVPDLPRESLVVGASAPGVSLGDVVPVAVWAVAVLVAASVYLAGWWRLRSARRAWRQSRVAGASVLVSPAAGPAAVGVLQPAIVVPEWLLVEDESVQRLVVLHEAEHLAAGDHLVLALAPLAIVLMPWNGVLWWMVRRLRLAIELDCDGRVLAKGVEPAVYGTLLLDVAGRRGVGALSIALASPRSALERRIEALVDGVPGPGPGRSLIFGVSAAVCLAVACGLAPTAPLDGVERSGVRAPELGADLVERFGGPATRWTIDGQAATAEAVAALAATDVAVVRVEESAVADEQDGNGETGSASAVHIASPGYVAEHPELASSPLRASRSTTLQEHLAEALADPRTSVVIDGRESDRAAVSALAEADIEKLEVVRRAAGDDVASEVRIRTRNARRTDGEDVASEGRIRTRNARSD